MQHSLDSREDVEAELHDPLVINKADMEVFLADDALNDLPVEDGKSHLSYKLRLFFIYGLTIVNFLEGFVHQARVNSVWGDLFFVHEFGILLL